MAMAGGPPGRVELVLLRGQLPDLTLRPGTFVTGKVLDPRTLLLQGVRLAAQLPKDVQPGAVLRLRVEESSTERLHLHVVESPTAAEAPAPTGPPASALAMLLPGGVEVRVYVDEREEAGGRRRGAEARSVVLRYDSPTLGRLDVRVEHGSAAVHVAAGEPAERVRAAADELRRALDGATGRPHQVTVHPRGETLDLRA